MRELFRDEEARGLKLSIKGRTLALVLLAVWFVGSRTPDPSRALEFLSVLIAFGLLGAAHYLLIGSRFDRAWHKYVFVAVDVVALSALIATQPLLDSVDLPQSIVFRNAVFPYYFVILGVAAFSFSSRS